ncbi:MAG TPA: winged helix DNA-binding domain-containing protein [Streptosporangiaceae bacterium]
MSLMKDPDPAILAQRFAAQLLTGAAATSAVGVVTRLLAVQGQDPRGARLAVRVRSDGLTAADVDHALTDDRSLLITWLNRGTLHLVCAEDYWWLHALTTPPLATGNVRRLAQEGVSADDAARAVRVIDQALGDDGPLTREQLAERIARIGVRTEGQAIVHLLFKASVLGIAVRGPMAGRKHAYVRVCDWLGARPARFDPARFDRDTALAELARRYLAGHGPASEKDLAKWAGLPLRDARRGLSAIAGELAGREDGLADLADRSASYGAATVSGRSGAAAVSGRSGAAGSGPSGAASGDHGVPPPRLLGAYDPLLLGWALRGPVLGPHQQVVTVNGLFRPFALVDGRAAATWSLAGGRVDLAPFGPLPERVTRALAADADDVIRFLGS